MIYLFFSIVSFVAMMLVFKLMEKFNADTFQTIAFNYITAAILALLIMSSGLSAAFITHAAWFPNAFIIGLSFITLFYLIGVTTQNAGVAVATVANKMSVIIPVVFAFFLYGDSVTFIKILGILLAIAGILMTTKKGAIYDNEPEPVAVRKKIMGFNLSGKLIYRNIKIEVDKKYMYLPVVLFLASGFLDTYINYTEKNYLENIAESRDFIPAVFSVSAIAATIILFWKIIISPSIFAFKNIFWGLVLGVFNYSSLYFFLESLKLDYMESSVVFTINNIGIVSLSSLASFVFFKEHLSRLNKTGIIVCIIAILLIAFS